MPLDLSFPVTTSKYHFDRYPRLKAALVLLPFLPLVRIEN